MTFLDLFGSKNLKEKLKFKFQSEIKFQKNKDSIDKLHLQDLSKFLKDCELFKSFTLKTLSRLATEFDELHLSKSKVVFDEGDPVDCFYIVKDGEFQLQKRISAEQKDT